MTDARKITTSQQVNIDIISGFITGIVCSGVFNPWDRALYLSVKNHRPFLSIDYFRSPYQGFSQAVLQRAFLGSIYYIMQGQLRSFMYPYLRQQVGVSEPIAQFFVGMIAGSFSGILTNSISAIKYHTWGHEGRSFISSSREMWQLGGIKPFIKGTTATVARDATFGSTYEVLRNFLFRTLSPHKHIIPIKDEYLAPVCNTTAAGVATIVSGPINYARTIQYATPPNVQPPTIIRAICDVWQEGKKHSHESFGRLRFFQQRFRVGWGTTRVAVGMAAGQKLFDWSREKLREHHASESSRPAACPRDPV